MQRKNWALSVDKAQFTARNDRGTLNDQRKRKTKPVLKLSSLEEGISPLPPMVELLAV
jgi:hypothetical protein